MGWMQSFAISQSGMNVERMRVEVTAANIANASIVSTPGMSPIFPLKVIASVAPVRFDQVFEQNMHDARLQGVTASIVAQQNALPRTVYEPSHPLADERGFVAYPGINTLDEMLTLTTAIRAYEANVVAFNAAKTMVSRALDIGGQ